MSEFNYLPINITSGVVGLLKIYMCCGFSCTTPHFKISLMQIVLNVEISFISSN